MKDRPRSSTSDEPDFAEEHARPTYEDEPDDLPDADRGDESVPEGPAGEGRPNSSKPL